MSRRTEEMKAMLKPVIEGMGYEFWGLEYLQGRGAVLRVFIDSENGIGVDDCADVSHQVSGVLDVEDPIPGEYNLEVSSPGMDRPLFEIEQWARYIGEKAQVRLLAAISGKRRFTAEIVAVKDEHLVLSVDGEPFEVPFTQVDRANLVVNLD